MADFPWLLKHTVCIGKTYDRYEVRLKTERPWIQLRREVGAYHALIRELEQEDQRGFKISENEQRRF
jgi:hypothetical protein